LQDLLDAVPEDRTVVCVPTHECLILHDDEEEIGRIPLDGVIDVSLLDESSVHRRPTLSRFLFLGPLAFFFPKKTVHEAYRLCIQWKAPGGGYRLTRIRVPRRLLAEQMLRTVKRSLNPESRREMARKIARDRVRAALPPQGRPPAPAVASPFIACGNCTVEFRKTDLPPGGRCPVCGRRFPGA